LGTWQLAVLCACLDQVDDAGERPAEDHLVLYGADLPADLKAAMSQLAAAADRTWTSVTWADDLLLKPTRTGGKDIGLVAALRSRLGFSSCDEVWVCKLYDFAEKVILEAMPTASVQLYEDGMHFYVSQPTIRGFAPNRAAEVASLPRRVARALVGRFDPWWTPGMWSRHTRRVGRMWLVTPRSVGLRVQELGEPHYIDLERLRAVVRTIQQISDMNEWAPVSDQPVAIVLGQAFARFGLMTEHDEAALYESVCRDLLDSGYEVLWKDHPRLENGFGPGLVASLRSRGPIAPLPLASAWPVEAAVGRIAPAALVSGTSTSLFACSALFDTPSYTFAASLRLPKIRRDHRRMVALTCAAFPSPAEICTMSRSCVPPKPNG
jgi:Alpha-2,8-polysialyltransferase (POLYST)